MSCGCNVFNEIGAGGSASTTVETIGGGVVCGGCARVEIYQDVYDGLEFCLPLNESGLTYYDRTANNLDGTAVAPYDPSQADGVFCSLAADFDGDSSQFITLPQDSIPANQSFTISGWIKIDTMFKTRRIFSRGYDNGSDKWVFNFGYSFINHLMAGIQTTDGTSTTNNEVYSSQRLSQDKTYHVSCVYDGSLSVFINGVLAGTNDIITGDVISQTNGGYISRFNDGAFHSGLIQELRLHPVAKSAGWLKAEHDNFCSSGFFTVGEEEEII